MKKTLLSLAATSTLVLSSSAFAQVLPNPNTNLPGATTNRQDTTNPNAAANRQDTTNPNAAANRNDTAQTGDNTRMPNSNSCFGQARSAGAQAPGPMGQIIRERAGTNPANNRQFIEQNCNPRGPSPR